VCLPQRPSSGLLSCRRRPRCPQDKKPRPIPGRPPTGQSIAPGASFSKGPSPRTWRNAPSVGGIPPASPLLGAWAHETEGLGIEAREHRSLPEASGRAHRATTLGPRSCSSVLTGAETTRLRRIQRQLRISTNFDGIATTKIKLFPNESLRPAPSGSRRNSHERDGSNRRHCLRLDVMS
jgi:hypothetical protein